MDQAKYSAMSIPEMFDKAFYIHRKHIGTSALYMLVVSLISTAVGLLIGFLSILPLFMFVMSNEMFGYGVLETGTYIKFAIIAFLFILLMSTLQYISHSGIILIGSNSFLNKRNDIGSALEGMFKNIPRVLSVVLAGALLFLPVAAVLVGIIIVLIKNYQITQFISPNIFYLIGIIASSCALAIWYVFFMTIHVFSIHVAILEKLTFFKALKRSRELVKGRFWRTLGSYLLFLIVVSIVTYSIYTIVGLIFGIIILLLKSMDFNELIISLSLLGNLLLYPIQIIISIFIGPLAGIFLTIFYYNQRFRKDAYDIELNLMQLKNIQ